MIQEFLISYAKLLVNHPDDISVEIVPMDEEFDEIIVYANSADVGKLIGKDGKMINSIKTVISGCKAKGGKSYRVNVKPKD
jgi:predicted RNA-binding protein YlqC (UPF0109 family)